MSASDSSLTSAKPAIYRIVGSGGYVGAARSVMLLGCPRENPASDMRVLAHPAANYARGSALGDG
jgi:hypothetical protein